MDRNAWADRVEQAVEDVVELEDLRALIAADDSLDEDDRQELDGRIATYLADNDREAGALDAGA